VKESGRAADDASSVAKRVGGAGEVLYLYVDSAARACFLLFSFLMAP
jgi:hypothetical protein